MKVTFVTGNANKAKYLSELIGLPLDYESIDSHEIQSLNLKEVGTHKAKQAFKILKKPVLVEDVSLRIHSLGQLPGPFIRWFIEEIGLEQICRLADVSADRSATASCVYVFYDGKTLKSFEGQLAGTIADHPRGSSNFGWNPTFIPDGDRQTLGEMADAKFKTFYLQIKPIVDVRNFLQTP